MPSGPDVMVMTTGDDSIIVSCGSKVNAAPSVTEIAPGTYGRVQVLSLAGVSDRHIGIAINVEPGPYNKVGFACLDAAELRAAAAVMTELADALEGGAK